MKISNFKVVILFAFLLALAAASLAANPTVTSVSPLVITQTWVGNMTITGSSFESGAVVYIGDGITGALDGNSIIPTTFVNSNTLKAYIRCSSGSLMMAHKLEVRNPSGGIGSLEAAFTVNASPLQPTVTHLFFDGVAYTAGMAIGRRPIISGTITDTSGLTLGTVDLKILVDNVVTYDNLSSEVTIDPGITTAKFYYKLPTPLDASGLTNLYFNVKNVFGDSGEGQCSVSVQEAVTPAAAKISETLSTRPISNPTTANPAEIQVKVDAPTNVIVRVLGSSTIHAEERFSLPEGYSKLYYNGGTKLTASRAAMVRAAAAGTATDDLPLSNGLHPMIIINEATGKVIGKCKIGVLN